jgi:hypothetical protein
MYVESKKRFRHGFVLNEPELRRLIDILKEQFEKLEEHSETNIKFKIKYKNGVVADSLSIDEVSAQENVGSSQVIRLTIVVHAQLKDSEEATTELEFINADLDDDARFVAIRYTVTGPERDWVFVLSSLLDERISKVKRFAPNQLNGRRSILLIPLMLLLIFMPLEIFMKKYSTKVTSTLLQSAVDSGEVQDALQAIIFLEKLKYESKDPLNPEVYGSMGYAFAALAILSAIFWFLSKFYPIFNFCWGDYVEEFNKKESTRKFILVVIVIGIVVSFIGGVLANLL